MEKLYGNKRKVLLYIYKHRNEHLTRFNVPDKIKSIPTYETRMYLKDLVTAGYINYIGINDTIQFKSKGLSYFSDETNYNIELIITSSIFPIIASFFTATITTVTTALVTLWLNGLL